MPHSRPEALSVYIHIPFCLSACPYCNFNFRLLRHYSEDFLEAYTSALQAEWKALENIFGTKPDIKSIYFGGGTPSLLPLKLLERLLATFQNTPADSEITLEANPEDLAQKGQGHLKSLNGIGIKRLSLGVQSLNEKTLKSLGRNHSAKDVCNVVAWARHAGFSNLSCDLMGGAPNQTAREFREDLKHFLTLEPEHISYYGLTLEPNTPFYTRYHRRPSALPSEKIQAEIYLHAQKSLVDAGFEHYEISNFARPAYKSLHNSGYWEFRNYAGLGAGAHSFLHRGGLTRRWLNEKDPKKYVAAINASGSAQGFFEELGDKKAMGEFIFTGLRKLSGFSLESFRDIFACDLKTVFATEIARLEADDLVRFINANGKEIFQLTPKGILFSDSAFEQFV